MFQKDKFWEKQKIYLWETWKKHIMCFSDFPFRNTLCVFVVKTLWKSQDMSKNGFFQGKQYLTPVLRHSFYFYFYFEHLNFTWSYLGDLISTIYDLILISWSYHQMMIQDTFLLLYYLHAFDMPLTHVFHWRLTCILHMLLRNMLLPYVLHVFALRTTHGH